MDIFLGIASIFVFAFVWIWSWRRIAAYHLFKGRNRWVAHGAGVVLGQIPALLFFSAAGNLNGETGSSTTVVYSICAIFIFSIIMTRRWTRLEPPVLNKSSFGYTSAFVDSITPADQRANLVEPPSIARDAILQNGLDGGNEGPKSAKELKQSKASNPASPPAISKPAQKTRNSRDNDPINCIDLPDKITFLYENAEGETTYRDVTVHTVDSNVRGHDYIEGYCKTAGATRTFRIDRMIGMITQTSTGEMLMPDDWLGRLGSMKTTKPSVATPPASSTSVLFTGFKKLDRERLESHATALGWHVRKTVSETLDYLVTGDNAGPAKIRDAEMLGVDIIDEDVFLDLMTASVTEI